eukprot:4950741-Pyramimonas_sp.AAC.1
MAIRSHPSPLIFFPRIVQPFVPGVLPSTVFALLFSRSAPHSRLRTDGRRSRGAAELLRA